jgi:hypothetical protein
MLHGHATSDPIPRIPFTYNPLHDLESIWWIATFFILHHFINGHDRQSLNMDVDRLFATSESTSRQSAFLSKEQFKDMVDDLPAALRIHGAQLDIFRKMLIQSYKFAESSSDINQAAFQPELYQLLRDIFGRLCGNPGSVAARVNDAKKQSLITGRDEVESSPSAGKGKIAKRKLSMDYTVPRRSTRLRKAVYEQQVDDEDVEHAKTSKRKTQADDPSYPATGSSLSAKKRERTEQQEGDGSVGVGESTKSAGKRKEANEQDLEDDDESSPPTK